MSRLFPCPRTQTVFALLSVADLTLTWLLLRLPDSAAYEANPVANWWLIRFGWAGLAAFKAVTVLVVFAAVAAVFRSRPRAAAGLLWFGCAVVATVVLYSASLFPSVFGRLSEAEAIRQAQLIDQVVEETNRTRPEYDRLMADLSAALIAGNCSLAEAVERVAATDRVKDPTWQRGLEGALPDHSPRARLATVVWNHVVKDRRAIDLPNDPVLRRIEQELQMNFGMNLPTT